MQKPRSTLIFKGALVVVFAAIITLSGSNASLADSYLLYKEVQLVVGSDARTSTAIFYSRTQEDVMQKPSLGFDYIYRFSGETGDVAAVYAQGRLAWNEQGDKRKIEPQLYNAFIKFKNPVSDLWVGHARVAYGLGSYFDSHALLLSTLDMYDLGFDRDWGAGLLRDFPWGDFALTYTTGSGMPLYAAGTELLAARISYGVLNADGFNFGISKAGGTLVKAMGYEVMPDAKYDINYTGIDAAYLFENYELRAENTSGTRMNEGYDSFMVRGGMKLLDEDTLKLELQETAYTLGGNSDHIGSIGISYLLDQDTTLRAMYESDELAKDSKLVAQVYYYAPW